MEIEAESTVLFQKQVTAEFQHLRSKQELVETTLNEFRSSLKNCEEFLKQLSEQNRNLLNFIKKIELEHESEDTSSNVQLHQLLEEIKETQAKNLGLLQEKLFKQSDEIQQLNEEIEPSKTEVTLTQLEQKVDRNTLGIRMILTSLKIDLEKLLISAVKSGDIQQILFLLELGANIECQDDNKSRPVHLAVQHNHLQVLEILLKYKADIESHGEHKKTPLHMAAYFNRLECAKLLIDKGANLESLDQWRNTPILHAAAAGYDSIVELLLKKGANVNACQEENMTGLHWTARNGHLSTAKILVNHGVNTSVKNVNGKTALDLALDYRTYSIAAFLQND